VHLEHAGRRRNSTARYRGTLAARGFDRQPTVEAGSLDRRPRTTRR
jgi:hypothetical protein